MLTSIVQNNICLLNTYHCGISTNYIGFFNTAQYIVSRGQTAIFSFVCKNDFGIRNVPDPIFPAPTQKKNSGLATQDYAIHSIPLQKCNGNEMDSIRYLYGFV